jgi:hypothetical protein
LFVVKVQGYHWRGHWGAARAEATKKTATTKTKPTTLRPAIVLGCRRRQLEERQYRSKKKIKLDHRRYVGQSVDLAPVVSDLLLERTKCLGNVW